MLLSLVCAILASRESRISQAERLLLVLYLPPFQALLQTFALSIQDWLILGALGAPVLLVMELYKKLRPLGSGQRPCLPEDPNSSPRQSGQEQMNDGSIQR